MAAEKQNDERDERDKGQQMVVPPEQAPGRPGVLPMHELKETGDDDFLLGIAQQPQHEPFRQLIEQDNEQRNEANAAIRRSQR